MKKHLIAIAVGLGVFAIPSSFVALASWMDNPFFIFLPPILILAWITGTTITDDLKWKARFK